MKLIFLGTGAAFSMKNYQSNLLIEENGKYLLVDAGGDIRFSLRDVNLSSKNIDAVYLTHLHNDHIGGMEYMAFTTFFDTSREKLKLYCHKVLVEDLWSSSLRGGLSSIQGQILNIYDYFNVHALNNDAEFEWQGIQLKMQTAIHVFNGFSTIPTFGLMMKIKSGKNIYLTSDTQFTPDYLKDAYEQADIIIHDCETSQFKTGVHAHYDDLKNLPVHLKNKILMWHYQDDVIDNFDEWNKKAIQDGFLGFLKKGEIKEF